MLYLLIIGLGVAIDQLSKWLIAARLPLGAGLELLPAGLLQIRHVRNTGAAWSLFADSTFALAVFSVLLLGALCVWFYLTPADRRGQRAALSVIMAGAVGNMLDRFRLGYVVDFIELPHWPVFNTADILLCCGAAALAALLLWEEKRQKSGK